MSNIKQVSDEKDLALAALCDSLNMSRATLYRTQGNHLQDNLVNDSRKPHNALNDDQKRQILDMLHSERFVDFTPYDVFYTLLDEGKYIASIRTMYRVLFDAGESKDRRDVRNHKDAVKPELIATAPNEVWSWDITKLLSFNRFVYFHLYVILDIFSRYVTGWMIADRECQHLAKTLIQKTALKHGIQPNQLILHSDNGPSMTSQTVSQLLDKIGVLKTHNRPYTSNDNPFSESHFKTLKYCPEFPDRFESIGHAEKFCRDFFDWYNNVHYHSGILFLKPTTVHFGQANEILKNRHQVLLNVYDKNPARFNHKIPTLKKLKPVYINPPKIELENIEKII
ncbi:MAG TPA: IS3 family transposase [Candidatus Saccharimonadales bacterium]|nr:IS3 family transposase [Candidatus Saccharimonadales bacterium]